MPFWKKIRFGLRLQFALGAVVFITFIVVSFTYFFINTYRQVLEKKLEEKGIALTQTLSQNSQSEYFLWLKNEDKLIGILRGVVGDTSDVIYGAFFDENKKPVAKRTVGGFMMNPDRITKYLDIEDSRTEVIW